MQQITAQELRHGDVVLTQNGSLVKVEVEPRLVEENIVEVGLVAHPRAQEFTWHWFADQTVEVERWAADVSS